ncbi:hypothetical protein BGZ99_007522 [Dissophora globulifera]|uniref:Uncharacterized protein n=1 Tax=Dissophora globulifera TaxID=979702 RepID=A0A9P6RAI9_9FUNG|nr:hypothetical protein BGZ99_007522 [Dissophora globulifera]
MTEPTSSTTSTTTLAAASDTKKPPGSGPIPITMDVYHQLQQKRLLERQKDGEAKGEQRVDQPAPPREQSGDSAAQQPSSSTSSTIALEQIVNIVQATAPVTAAALPTQRQQQHHRQQPQQAQLPGPDLTNIIFGHSAPVSTSTTTAAPGQTATPSASRSKASAVVAAADASSSGVSNSSNNNGNNNNNHPHQHRKTTTGNGQGHAGSQPSTRTTSPPTQASGSSSWTAPAPPSHKSQGAKGQKAIHAIELIRIAGEILQFPPNTTGTALIYYHKYRAYLHQANRRGERDNEATKADEYLFATACLHLACKCTEVSRKVRDLVNVTYRVMNPNQPVLSLSTKPNDDSNRPSSSSVGVGSSSQQQLQYPIAPPPTVATYWHIRDSLLTTELMLLRILQFDLDVALPFSDVLRIFKGMGMVFSPTEEEAALLYPYASNFDVFLPAMTNSHQYSSSTSPNKPGMSSSSSSSSSTAPNASLSSVLAPHTGIHPTLSALVQVSTTFCIDALCSSTIALHSSSRALAMGSIYLAVRSAGLELPLPFEDWCYAWGRPNIVTGFGIQTAGGSGGIGGVMGGGIGASGSLGGIGGVGGAGLGGSGVSGVNGIMGLSSGTNNLFVSSPRPAATMSLATSTTTAASTAAATASTIQDSSSAMFMEGLEMTNGGLSQAGTNGGTTSKDSVYSQTHSPSTGNPQASPSFPASLDGSSQDHVGSSSHGQPPQQQPMTIVDEVRKVVQELGSFYTH